ncbi:MAG: response regulator [Lysobacterales bacterium]
MTQTVFIVDDDDAVRGALGQMLEISGFNVKAYADGSTFVSDCDEHVSGCVLLDMAMPVLDGHGVQAQLNARGIRIPVIFLSGHGEVPDAVQAVQAGAMDFLQKPATSASLLASVRKALALDLENREADSRTKRIHAGYAMLSPREKEVMALVTDGLANKEIARKLKISPRTVEVHRNHVMYKMGAESLAHLVKMSAVCHS